MREKLTTAPVLGYPDRATPNLLNADASDMGVGAVLSQVQDGKKRVFSYCNKTLAPPKKNYCITQNDLLVVKCFRPY